MSQANPARLSRVKVCEYHHTMTTTSPQWTHLKSLARRNRETGIANLLRDESRLERFTASTGDLYLDFSKHLVTEEILDSLLDLATGSQLKERVGQLVSGATVNVSEGRAALHTGLRNPETHLPDGFAEHALAEREKLATMSEAVRNGSWTGHTGKAITDIITIGIGGSDLGPRMVTEALREYHDGPRIHFISNVDGAEILSLLPGLDAETTLVSICSKTFTTQETMINASTALTWLADSLGIKSAAASPHCIGITGNPEKALAFGISESRLLTFKDSIGGRYSTWSSIGFPACAAMGYDHFAEFLEGGAEMDRHFINTDFSHNMPVLMALLGVWYNNFLGAQSHAVIPYCQRLRLFVDHLQQLDMESNGKSSTLDNQAVESDTGPVIWGQTGTNGQHAFFQLLHQGTRLIPVDFIGVVTDRLSDERHHRVLLANMVAQAEALMTGRSGEDAHRFYPGNRPSSTLLLAELTPHNLGMLLALYEHKVYTQSVIWSINAFDQWGVELGKQLANDILDGKGGHDPSTLALLRKAGLTD